MKNSKLHAMILYSTFFHESMDICNIKYNVHFTNHFYKQKNDLLPGKENVFADKCCLIDTKIESLSQFGTFLIIAKRVYL